MAEKLELSSSNSSFFAEVKAGIFTRKIGSSPRQRKLRLGRGVCQGEGFLA